MKKNIKYSIILAFVCVIMYAQQFPILRTVSYEQRNLLTYNLQDGDYIKDVNNQLDAYVGTWKYISPDRTLTLKMIRINEFLTKSLSNSPDDFYVYKDVIILKYKLEDSNGNVIFDNLNSVIPSFMTNEVRSVLDGDENTNFINGTFTDFTKMVSVGRCEIKKLPSITGQPEKIYFELFENHSRILRPSFNAPPYVPYVPGQLYSVPNRIELIKQ